MRRLLVAVVVLMVAAGAPADIAAAEARPENFRAHLSGGEEVPVRDTRATGQATFQVDEDAHAMGYRLIVANIDNVVAAHIHIGPRGDNGAVVAFLFGPEPPGGGRSDGVIAEGSITSADLVGPMVGQSLEDLLTQMRAGNTYVNVHTDDGEDPPATGPGDFPGGEIRGQIV